MHDAPSTRPSGQAGAAAPRSRSAARACRPEGTLHFWDEGILFVGRSIANKPHRHFTASLIFALRGSFRARFGGSPWRSMRGVLVAPNLDQQLDARGCDLVICQIDPETNAYARLSGTLALRGPVWELPPELIRRLGGGTEETLARSGFRVSELWELIIGCVNGPTRAPLGLDARVARVLEMLKADLCARTSVGSLAVAVRLSPSRLVHLFNAQMGMSLRRYVLWLRMRQVVFSLALGRTLTDASHEAGFADSAHLCRTFRSMFGLSLSSLFKSSGVKFVVTPPEGPPAGPHGPYDRERWAAVSAGRPCAGSAAAAGGASAAVRS